jgi:hypothetical protein
MTKEELAALAEKIEALPEERLTQIERYVDFLKEWDAGPLEQGQRMTDAKLEAAVRAFLRFVRPASAELPMEMLNAVDIDDSSVEVVDAMRAAIEAYEAADC